MSKGFIFLVLGMFAGSALGDVLHMTNGDRITGKLDSLAGDSLVFTTEYSNNMVVALTAVASIATEENYQIRTQNDVTYSGQLVVSSTGTQQIKAEDGKLQNVVLNELSRIGQNKLTTPDLGDGWESRLDFSAVASRGNSSTDAYNLLGESKFVRGSVEHLMTLSLSQEEAEEVKTKDQVDFDYGYKRFLNEKWYAAGNGEYFQDRIKDVDQRITLGAGIGHQFWDDSFGALSAEVGASAVFEDLNGETGTNPALRWALNYNRFLFDKKAEFFHKHSLLVILDSDSGEIIQSSTGLRFSVNGKIDTSIRVDTNTDTEPLIGAHRSDMTYNLGVGVKF